MQEGKIEDEDEACHERKQPSPQPENIFCSKEDSLYQRFNDILIKSKTEFTQQYSKLDDANKRELYLQVLIHLAQAISEGDINIIIDINNLLDIVTRFEKRTTLQNYYSNAKNPFKKTNIFILACKHQKPEALTCLFSADGVKILNNLSYVNEFAILPDFYDEECHNAFYYAIRSNDTTMLKTLITKWPDHHSYVDSEQFEKILAMAYEELKLKNVLLSEDMEIFVQNTLINMRFFSNNSHKKQKCKSNFNINGRVKLILKYVSLLNTMYSDTRAVDELFLFVSKFIAQNIHVLKQRLMSTYDRLPWEEIEFCLVVFVLSHSRQQEMNLFYRIVLNKTKILKYLNNFAKLLEIETKAEIAVNYDILKINRGKIIRKIINEHGHFDELYNDYQQIRDIYSLEKIQDYAKLGTSVNPTQRQGQLTIMRVLQVVGEHMKDSLESPKMSSITSDLILLSLPKNTREVITGVRNSLSHSDSLCKRTEIEEDANEKFFVGIQTDIKEIGIITTDIIYDYKNKIVKNLLNKINESESLGEIKEVVGTCDNQDLQSIATLMLRMDTKGRGKLGTLVNNLSEFFKEKTPRERHLFEQLNTVIESMETRSDNVKTDYTLGLSIMQGFLTTFVDDYAMDENLIREMKLRARETVKGIAPKTETGNLKKVGELSAEIFRLYPRFENAKVYKLFCEIFHIVQSGTSDIKWIEELKEKLNDKGCFIPRYKRNQVRHIFEEKYNKLLTVKLNELKEIVKNGELLENFSSFRNNKELHLTVEMLVLDVMSIISCNKLLTNNFLFLDDYAPSLTGKSLRNHLAHDNALMNILLPNPLITIISNAMVLVSENIKDNRTIGKSPTDNPTEIDNKFENAFAMISNQRGITHALENGSLDTLKYYLKRGTDLHGRNKDSGTAFHSAAKGGDLVILRFILEYNVDINAKDVNGQTPLHIAAAYGNKEAVDFFIKEATFCINSTDNRNRTPLHYATLRGHQDIVEILLQNGANPFCRDQQTYFPLHYAIPSGHTNLVKILLQKYPQYLNRGISSGFTLMHLAAEFNQIQSLKLLLQYKLSVDAKTDRNWTPLHGAAQNGYVEIAVCLIENGANVNGKVINGRIPLHYAVENGHEMMTKILLKHKADVNTKDKTWHYTPLHIAARDGRKSIVEILLENGGNPNVKNIDNMTPLHYASGNGHMGIVVDLLKKGVNINAKNKNGQTALIGAIMFNHQDIVQVLIKSGSEIDPTALLVASTNGLKNIVDILIQQKIPVNIRDVNSFTTPLIIAAANGHIKVIRSLIKNCADINAKNNIGHTALHAAAKNGHHDTAVFLIQKGANVNIRSSEGLSPLHCAALNGHSNIVKALVKNNSEIDAKSNIWGTPLFAAVQGNHTDIVRFLIENKADINMDINNLSPILSAIKNNNIETTRLLISKNAKINLKTLTAAVLSNNGEILRILLQKNIEHFDHSLLHLAAEKGCEESVQALISAGLDVNATTWAGETPLYLAASSGSAEVAELLMANNADVNFQSFCGTPPLHIAAEHGHVDVVRILLSNGADVNLKDGRGSNALEYAVALGHLPVVKTLLEYEKSDLVNAETYDNATLLHIASQEHCLDIIKYLVRNGGDLNAKNSRGSKPIHIAAREGNKDIVEYFLNIGMSINELGLDDQKLIHYASYGGQLEVVKYLISKGADVNVKDLTGLTPVHMVAFLGHKEVMEELLKNGAYYNAVDNLNGKPLDFAKNYEIIALLNSVKTLFDAVKSNNLEQIEKWFKTRNTCVNSKCAEGTTPLHFAAWKGYNKIVDILLQNKADPNAVNKTGATPLHYACKFSHFKIVVSLLCNGAIYNAPTINGKTPLNFAGNEKIINLLKLTHESFKGVKSDSSLVISKLKEIKEINELKAIMCCLNEENTTLVVVAIKSNFTKIDELKWISQDDLSFQMRLAATYCNDANYAECLNILLKIYEKKKELLGTDNPSTLEVKTEIAKVLFGQGKYQDALKHFDKVFKKQQEILGSNNQHTLYTRSYMALVLHRLGRNDEAYEIFEVVYQKQKDLLGPHHENTLGTGLHFAMVLQKQSKFERALEINREYFEINNSKFGPEHLETLHAKNNIALILVSQGKHEEAIKIYEEVLEKKKAILGIGHVDTLRTWDNIALALSNQQKHDEAIEMFKKILNVRVQTFGPNHPDTLSAQLGFANTLFQDHRWISALKVYYECYDGIKSTFGPDCASFISKTIEVIKKIFNVEGRSISEVLQQLQTDINIAAFNGDIPTIQRLLESGIDVNEKDVEGRRPLHFAVNNNHISVVKILLENGADVTQVSNKGNTSLHIAVSKSYRNIAETLLNHVSDAELSEFVNAKTVANGTAALHVAAENGNLDLVKLLLTFGAIHNIKNGEGKTPLNLSNDQNVTDLLELIALLFKDVKRNNIGTVMELEMRRSDELKAVLYAQDKTGNTLLTWTLSKGYHNISIKLLEIMRKLSTSA